MMDKWEEIEQIAETILSSAEERWSLLCEELMLKYTSEELPELADRLKLQSFDRFLHTDLTQARRLASFLLLFGEIVRQPLIHGLGLLAQADALFYGGQPNSAVEAFEQAGEVFLQAGKKVSWARARGGWVFAATHAGIIKTQDLASMNDACRILREAGPDQRFRLASVEQNIGLAWKNLGYFHKALDLFKQALETLGSATSPAEVQLRGMILANTATIFLWLGNLAQAATLLQQAHTVFLETRNRAYTAQTEMHLSLIERLLGHWRAALLMARTATQGLRETKRPTQTALALIYQADLLLTLNRYEEAAAAAKEAVTLLSELETPVDLINACCIQARALYRCGDEQGALESLLAGEHLLAQAGSLQMEYPLPLERALLLLSCGKFVEAKEVAFAFLKSSVAEEAALHRQMALLIAAEAALSSGEQALACTMAREIIRQGEQLHMPELRYRGHLVLARAAYESKDLPTALLHFDRVTSILSHLQTDLVYDQRSEFLEDKDALYLEAILVALEGNDPLKAFTYLEQRHAHARWHIFTQYNENTTNTGTASQEPHTELEELLRCHRAISESLLTLSADSLAFGGARKELKRLARRIGDLQEAQAWKEATIPSLDGQAILNGLPTDRTILAYALAKNDLVIFLITRQQVFPVRLSGGAKQLRTLDRFLHLLEQTATVTNSQEYAWRHVLHQLWSLLIAPVERYLPPEGELLTIIPSEQLYALPLSALYDGKRYLTERWTLHCVPSCQTLAQTVNLPEISRSVLALGYSNQGSLPAAPEEARYIAKLLGGTSWVEEEATGERLRREGSRQKYLHIAAHGAFRLDTPHSSFLQLADGLFHPTDVLTLDLRGCRLVTLSACRTGRGRPGGGDEQIGL
ncbi:MAG TPA: CHAT domain-containing protein, partial [Ktedonobacteraceae bacterium]|nr:CHAT domain-containing protein [Ktedonobacteraceae bacterium]